MSGKIKLGSIVMSVLVLAGCDQQLPVERMPVETLQSIEIGQMPEDNGERIVPLLKQYLLIGGDMQTIYPELDEEMQQKVRKGEVVSRFSPVENIVVEEYSCEAPMAVEAMAMRGIIEGEMKTSYQVEVTTVRRVQPLEETAKRYEQLYSQTLKVGEKDSIKLLEKYWVTLDQQQKLVGIKQADGIYYERIPFEKEEAVEGLIGSIRENLEDTLGEAVKKSGYEAGGDVLIAWDKVSIEQSPFATQKQPRFVVSVPVTLLLNHYNKVYYKYNYLISTEAGQMKWIKEIGSTPTSP